MSAIGQIYYHVLDNNTGAYISNVDENNFFDTNIVPSGQSITKLGIQAPPGTLVTLNTNKKIMIGRTGIYELDAGILVTSIVFNRPSNYKKLDDETNALLRVSGSSISEIEASRANQIAALGAAPTLPDPPTDAQVTAYTAYWNNYNSIQSSYAAAYETYLAQYNQGLAGVYILDEQNPGDLYNVVVDFIYD